MLPALTWQLAEFMTGGPLLVALTACTWFHCPAPPSAGNFSCPTIVEWADDTVKVRSRWGGVYAGYEACHRSMPAGFGLNTVEGTPCGGACGLARKVQSSTVHASSSGALRRQHTIAEQRDGGTSETGDFQSRAVLKFAPPAAAAAQRPLALGPSWDPLSTWLFPLRCISGLALSRDGAGRLRTDSALAEPSAQQQRHAAANFTP